MLKFIDQLKREINLKEFPNRIISLVPSQTELLIDLGLADRIVGITKFCIHPNTITKDIPKVGGTKKFNFAKIDSLNPDLIIANKEENYHEGIERLAQKYAVWISDIIIIEDAYKMIECIGLLTNKEYNANKIIESIKNSHLEFELFNKMQQNRPNVAYFIWKKPWMVAASNTFINNMLHLSGFKNAFETLERYPEVSLDLIKEKELDFIFLSSEPYPFKERDCKILKDRLGVNVVLVDGEMFSWYGSRLAKSFDYFKRIRQQTSNENLLPDKIK